MSQPAGHGRQPSIPDTRQYLLTWNQLHSSLLGEFWDALKSSFPNVKRLVCLWVQSAMSVNMEISQTIFVQKPMGPLLLHKYTNSKLLFNALAPQALTSYYIVILSLNLLYLYPTVSSVVSGTLTSSHLCAQLKYMPHPWQLWGGVVPTSDGSPQPSEGTTSLLPCKNIALGLWAGAF